MTAEVLPAPAFTIEKYPSRAAWLQARHTGIGGSDAATIAAPWLMSRWSTPYGLWAEKSGLVVKEDAVVNEYVDWGNRIEPLVVQRVAEEYGRPVVYCRNMLYRNAAQPWLLASPDAVFDDEECGIEAKAVGERQAEKWRDEPPLQYVIQTQHQMLVTGYQRWVLAALIGGQKFRVFEIERDERFIAALAAAEDAFWRRVLEGRPPRVDGHEPTSGALLAMFPAEDPSRTVTLPQSCLAAHRRRMRCEERVEKWERIMRAATQEIQAAMGEALVGVLPQGAGSYRWRKVSKKEHTVKATTYREFRFRESQA